MSFGDSFFYSYVYIAFRLLYLFSWFAYGGGNTKTKRR